MRRAIGIWGIMAVMLLSGLALLACGEGGDGAPTNEAQTIEVVKGLVLEVEAESLISLAALDVQGDDGTVFHIEGRGKIVPGFTPSHLNDHKLLGLPVEVRFYREGEVLVLHGISD